jgi:RNA polymerase sigma-B factor
MAALSFVGASQLSDSTENSAPDHAAFGTALRAVPDARPAGATSGTRHTSDPSGVQEVAREDRHARVRDLLERMAASTDPAQKERLMRRVVLEHRGAARSVAARYRGRGVEQADLEQLAYLGLVKAARRWQPGHCADFLQFAVPTMTGEIKRYFRDHSWLVRPPRRIQELRSAMALEESDTTAGLPRSETDLSSALGVSAEAVREARQAGDLAHPRSLDAPSPSGQDWGDCVGGAEEGYDTVEDRLVLSEVLAVLTERERRVVALRYEDGMSQADIGRIIGVSQMQISRILRAISTKVRARWASRELAYSA